MSTSHSGPATPAELTTKGRATRARVVAVAADLMHERGVSATSISDIKHAAGVSAGQVAHYFGDKHALVRAVIGYQTDQTIAAQLPVLDELDSMDALRSWCDLNVAHLEAGQCVGGCRIGSLAGQLAEASPEFREDLAHGFESWRERIERGLVAMRDRGQLRTEADPAALSTSFLAALEGGTLLAQTNRDSAPLRVALDTMLAFLEMLAPSARQTTEHD